MSSNVFLLLGTNLGEKKENLKMAKIKIRELIGPILKHSSLYKTAAWGLKEQPDFLNEVVVTETDLNPDELLIQTQRIEENMGRVRNQKWGARTIDIDILFFDNVSVDKKNLTIPHPRIPERRFTLIPLVEVDPQFVHPVLHKTMQQLLTLCDDPSSVEKVEL